MVPPMMEAIHFGTYVFFLGWMGLGVAYAIWILPETRNVSLEAMDQVFKSGDATHDASRMHAITERLMAEYSGGDGSSVKKEHSHIH